MAISGYSTNANLNTAAPPNGAPEGMAPSNVDNVLRQIMADIRAFYESANYIDLGHTPTYASVTTFLVATDVTSYYTANRPIRCTDTSTLYGYVVSSSYAAPNTTVTVALSSGSLSASLSAVAVGLLDPTYSSIAAACIKFLQSGTGAVATDLQTRGQKVALSTDYDTTGHFQTARNALTATFAAANYSFPSTFVTSSDANTLDAYKRGTAFTPTIIGASTAGVGTYTNQVGRYSRIGDIVFFSLYVAWTAHTGTGLMSIAGMPYISNNAVQSAVTIGYFANIALTSGDVPMAIIDVSKSQIDLYKMPSTGGAMTALVIDTSAGIMVAGHYFV